MFSVIGSLCPAACPAELATAILSLGARVSPMPPQDMARCALRLVLKAPRGGVGAPAGALVLGDTLPLRKKISPNFQYGMRSRTVYAIHVTQCKVDWCRLHKSLKSLLYLRTHTPI